MAAPIACSLAKNLPSDELDPLEAHRVLTSMARRPLRPVPPEHVASHVLELMPDVEWRLRREALEALLRRGANARREGLKVARRPAQGQPFGEYRTRSKGGGLRPYRTTVDGLSPLRTSCDCTDFVRSSLGLCKHGLVALVDIAGTPRRLRRALAAAPSSSRRARLWWDPMRPLTGEGDLLAQLRFEPARGRGPSFVEDLVPGASSLGASSLGASSLAPAPEVLAEPSRRAALVSALRRWSRKDSGRVAPAALRVLDDEARSFDERAAARCATGTAERSLAGLRRPLYPYQQEAVSRFLSQGRLLLADDMGLGKTVQATAACHALFEGGAVHRGLLVVPASLKSQWLAEWESFTDTPLTLVDGPPGDRARLYRDTRRGFLLIGYAQLRRDLPHILRFAPEVVVLDEAQRMKNWATKTAASIKRLTPAYRLALTGTPLENRLEELASIMDWVDDRALAPKWRLGPLHVTAGGVRHLATLRQRLAPHMLRRRREEVLEQLPERSDQVLAVPMSARQHRAHAELDPRIARLVRLAARRPLTQPEFLRLMTLLNTQRVIANGMAQADFLDVWPQLQDSEPTEACLASLASPKLLRLREIVRGVVLEQGQKVVVFSQWRRMLELAAWACGDLLREQGQRAVFFTGRESTRVRTRNIVDFHDEPSVPMLFASDAGGVGLNLQRAASCCVQLEIPWNPAVFEQRVARLHRHGQREHVDVITLASAGSIEDRIARISRDKRTLFTGLFDGEADVVDFGRAGSLCQRIALEMEATALVAEVAQVEPALEEAPLEEAPLEEAPLEQQPAAEAEVEPEQQATSSTPAPTPSGIEPATASVPELFEALRFERGEDGGMRIEAPPESAAALEALFLGMARLMREARPAVPALGAEERSPCLGVAHATRRSRWVSRRTPRRRSPRSTHAPPTDRAG